MKKKILTVLLAAIACFTGALGGCKEDETPSGTTGGGSTTAYRTFEGTHVRNVQESNSEYLVKNGQSKYKILVANDSPKYAMTAAQELTSFFNQATGVALPIEKENESGYTHNENQRYISIGKTKLFASTGLTADKTVLEREGFRIVTKDNNIYIFTVNDIGNAYGVYELLNILFNFEYYADDCIEIDEGVREKKLPILDVTEVPDIPVRRHMWGSITNSTDINSALRFRYTTTSTILALGDTENGQNRKTFHNSGEVLPVGTPTDEKAWHADGNNQLCYTAHGDAESYARMVSRAAYIITSTLEQYPVEQYPDYMLCSISCEDELTACNCWACTEEMEKYGARSGSVIKFCNNVMKEVRAWMDLEENAAYKREEFYLAFFAYFMYLQSPTHYDEALGKYVVNHPDVEMRDDVCVYYAISSMTSTVSMYDSGNDDTRAATEAWFDVAPATYLWTYAQNNAYYPSMWPSFEHYDEKGYQFYASGNPIIAETQYYYDQNNVTGFQALSRYIDAKMKWNCNLDIDVLKENFFNAMYGETAGLMKKLFEREVYFTSNMYEENYGARKAHGWGISFAAKDWSISELEVWLGICDQARALNEKLYKNSNPEKYEMIKYHIDQEYYFPAYAVVMGFDRQTIGQTYVDVIKYLQANIDNFRGFVLREGYTEDTVDTWKNIVV